MKKINDLKDGDLLWFRLTYKDNGLSEGESNQHLHHRARDSMI